jgi:hypothetical protein
LQALESFLAVRPPLMLLSWRPLLRKGSGR